MKPYSQWSSTQENFPDARNIQTINQSLPIKGTKEKEKNSHDPV